MAIISVSLPDEYLKELDRIVEKEGFSSRSEAIRHSLDLLISSEDGEGNGYRMIVVLSDHSESTYVDRNIIGIIHAYAENLKGLYHQILGEGLCITVAITSESGDDWKLIAKKLRKLRGVLQVRVMNL